MGRPEEEEEEEGDGREEVGSDTSSLRERDHDFLK